MSSPDPMKVSPIPSLIAGVAAFAAVVGWSFLLVLLLASTGAQAQALGNLAAMLAFLTAGGTVVGTQLWRSRPRMLGKIIVVGALAVGLGVPLFILLASL